MLSQKQKKQRKRHIGESHFRASDLRAAAQIATAATLGITRIVEGVHQSVLRTLGAREGQTAGRTSGLTGWFYKAIQAAQLNIGKGAEGAFAALEPLLDSSAAAAASSSQREAVLAVLNGVMGDRLLISANPLATPMSLRINGELLLDERAQSPTGAIDNPGGRRILLMIHGLCMNDLQWTRDVNGQPFEHGQSLAQALGYTCVHLRYNTGLHVSQNGQRLAQLLETLLSQWPSQGVELSVLAHSMGGLVMRSACLQAAHIGMAWPNALKRIVFLGTPHHGAPLEKAGSFVHSLLGATPYTAPFMQLARLRSSGITDLRYGNVLESDWFGQNRFSAHADRRTPAPLPTHVACYAVAATLASRRSLLVDRLVGDGLVPLQSALGRHAKPELRLAFPRAAQFIAYRTGHMDLLNDAAVAQQLHKWLSDSA